MRNYLEKWIWLFFAFLLIFTTIACRHVDVKSAKIGLQDEVANTIKKRDVALVFVPDQPRIAAHILYQQKDHYNYNRIYQNSPFKIDFTVNPLMRNPNIVARVERNGVLQREVIAKRTAINVLSEKKNSWSPTRSKLSLTIPFLTEGENVVVTTSYEWMDIRWLPPIFLQNDSQIEDATLAVDVPFGVTMRFKSAKDGKSFDFIPASIPQDKSLWMAQDNSEGRGVRYFWQAVVSHQSSSQTISNLLQVFLAFDNPSKSENNIKFDTWESVAKYLYDRIDRYDLPSNEIRQFIAKETRDLFEVEQKIDRVFSFLQNEIEKRPVSGTFQEQDVQPATRTFTRKFGSPFDIAILGKAMLLSIGLNADLVAVGDKFINPKITDMFSPALYSSVILAVENNNSLTYFDPASPRGYADQLDVNFQGQLALLLRPKKGSAYSLPFAVASKNTQILSYQLWLTNDGLLEGEYSFDLSGLETTSLKTLARGPSGANTPHQIEDILGKKTKLPFSLETSELYDEDL
ncbi:MAG TPA: hypothetical protein VEL47_03350, partial [Myxococcota bacterium]|nr:hypothetical protein [Myxococcota bacterium]